ncbi:hypothetical protein acdb102_36260 [Acidothermaceae bacterium B102]|nr:hypothetical protein acdb102_36260 [Acidothermaceae bacterium B102]
MNTITDPMAQLVARSNQVALAHSALPWSPVVPEITRETRHLLAVRSVLAQGLQTLAARVEPRQAPCTLVPGR